ncbi:Sjogren's syndrome/scleroderma autoantigen 1 family protein [Fictibacillus enclensis]|uniref:Sjogren's syndrome/scleroderma autoantigen 1 family protein n=1 Tax=Fictibacillus enclensis TaxID=1017270 RepID=UPI003334F43A
MRPARVTKISRRLIKSHTPNSSVLQNFQIPQKDILTGVHCPVCSSMPMTRLHSRWFCPSCGHSSKNAHLTTLEDYY